MLWQIQTKERSTTQRRGNTWNPRGGSSFCQSTFLLSLEPTRWPTSSASPQGCSCADVRRAAHSILKYSPLSPCPCPLLCKRCPTINAKGAQIVLQHTQ